MGKPILCLDFDGVIHSYSSGWKGADVIPDPPVAGAIAFMLGALHHFQVVIFSSRSHQAGGQIAMKKWLKENAGAAWYGSPAGPGIEDVQFVNEKPPAMITIDDRALTFDGTWPDIAALKEFKPWNKREFGATGEFPHGKLDATDEGALKLGIAWDGKNGVVRIDFGKPTAWLAIEPPQAIEFAKTILKKAGAKKIEVTY